MPEEVDPKTLKLRVPLTFTVAKTSKLAAACPPELLAQLGPHQKPVNVVGIEQVTIETGKDLEDFINKVGQGEYVFASQHGVPPLTIQLLMILAGNVIGYDRIDVEDTKIAGGTDGQEERQATD